MSDDGDSIDFRPFREELAEMLYTSLCTSMGITGKTAAWTIQSMIVRRRYQALADLAIRKVSENLMANRRS